MTEGAWRAELGDFLRARRGQITRAEVGLPPLGRGRRGVGLRREEVAVLSGVSVTWYTWLEQGREIHPSRQVLDAIARALRLSGTEHDYVLALAGYAAPRREAGAGPQEAPGHVRRLLDALAGYPSYAIAPDWGISAWNAAYARLYPNVASVPAVDRNLLWLVFTDPYVRALLPDWQVASRRFLAEFRAEAGPRLGEPGFTALIERLRAASPAFREGWENHDIEGFTSRERVFLHPVAGELRLEHHRLAPSDHPGLHLVVYTPMPGTDAAERLRLLGGEVS
ncbi:transcriptional regulator with XRE-family HTH domain [Thermocatellispora tengchongensis]|uniref:Transcriptional regulator with XRE-family HTH domain n=1 Tax=Thermocatellispora tengchongensis TaxID=1073253 RepID=A0A840PJU3_9ACTN|nr:helix-turn-helix transcriptional regulator [Thermocatellispora tengchongensis]MBB5139176.1 transcriptional regulator with XRE-family HTH domain [Thermocatellispora tengchongensis]